MKKSSIPATQGRATSEFVESVKENIEILTGRRGNKIILPEIQTLSFSATPTQAEYQALNQYINAWTAVMKALVTRIEG